MVRRAFGFVIVLLLAGGSPMPLSAAEWFVAPGGTGSGSRSAPFGRVQDGLNVALPGDTVIVQGGTYQEALRTLRPGSPEARITVRAEPGSGPVVVTFRGTVLRVTHPYTSIEGITLDGQYGGAVAVAVEDGGSFLVLRGVEVQHAGRDCVDLAAPQSVLIEDSRIHHCLNPAGGRADAHGIVAGAVRDLTVRRTEIHTFSGDGIQMDPVRTPAGWNGVLIEGCRIWLAPLGQPANGFPQGAVTGENAIDTKTPDVGVRAQLVVRDTLAWGFRGAVENQAAFNLKEHVDATIDGVTVWDSEIAFRLRGPTTRPGAWVLVQNSVIWGVATAVRYEDNIENLRVWNNTFGLDVRRPFQAASSRSTGVDVRNLLLVGARLPAEAVDRSNLALGPESFVDAATGDYHLAPQSPAVDTGVPLETVLSDRDGHPRPHGVAPDVGAYEWIGPTIANPPGELFGPQ